MGPQGKTWVKPTELVWLVLRASCLLAVAGIASAQNPIVIENQQPGSSQWQIPWGSAGTDVGGQIKGYASATSVNKGQKITFYVSVNPGQNYTIDVYRMGWYQGLGGRLMQHIGPLKGSKQPTCPTNATTGMIECQWAAAYTLTTQTSWTSGVYLALLTNSQGYKNYINFVVRDDSRIAALLYQQPVATYQAYNDYPYDKKTGKSLYAFNSYGVNTVTGGPNAAKVSFDRPYMGDGTGIDWGQSFISWEFAFVRWMENSGYDVTYATDVDTHVNGSTLLNYRGVLSVGHNEYFSKPMYDSFVAARDAGVNLGFFGANPIYWQVRFESSSRGVPNRVVVCYRDATIDPISDATLKTVQWRDPLLNRPEQTLIGVQYTNQVMWQQQYAGYVPYVVMNSANWVYAGAGFRDGDSVPGIVGYEADRLFGEYPPPNAVSGTSVLLSSSPFTSNQSTPDYANSSIYQAQSGAWVFGAGTIGWSRALDNYNNWNVVDPRIQQTTANILNRFVAPRGDFTMAVSPSSATVIQGGATSYGVSISPTGGFTGQVTLSVSGLPSGAGGSFSPNPATTSSALSVTTSTSTPPGTYTLTITGVSGTLTHAVTVAFVVNAAVDFTVGASPSSQTVLQGGATNYSVSISPTGGFTGQVTLSVSGLPSGASGSFSPNPATTASTLSVATSTNTPLGTYTVTITGVSGTLTHTTTVSLTVAVAQTTVGYDNKVSSGFQWGVTTAGTPAFTIGSGTNRAAMIMVAMSANNATNITASLGGVSGTLVPGSDSGKTATIRTLIFQVINPPSGSQTATVSWTTSMNVDVGVIVVSGADQTTPCTNGTFTASNSTPSATTSVTISSSPGDLTASIGYTGGAWATPFTNQTLRWGVDSAAAGGDIGSGTGTTTHTWTSQYFYQTTAVSGANFKAAVQ